MIAASLTAVVAYAMTGYLAISGYIATTTADRLLTLAVAAIGAGASIVAAVISRGNRQEIRGRRVVVTKSDEGTVIANEDLDHLEPDRGGD